MMVTEKEKKEDSTSEVQDEQMNRKFHVTS